MSDLARQLRDDVLTRMKPGAARCVLGAELARQLGARQVGQRVTLVLPDGRSRRPAARRA